MRILIVGAGAVGFFLARRLAEEAHEVAIIDPDPVRIQHVSDNLDVLAIRGSGADGPTLEEAGLARAEILMAVSGVDEVNLLACLAASRRGVGVKVARVRHPEHLGGGGTLSATDLGVDLLIGPEQECAWEIYQLLATPAATDLARFAEDRVQLLGLRIREGARIAGRSLAQLDRELDRRSFVVAAVVRGGRTEIPTGSTVLDEGDKVFFLAPTGEIGSLAPLAGFREHRLRRVMIAGGSDEAVYLAQHLARDGVDCTIFERDRDRSRELAELLPSALVLQADATDLELLEMEGVEGIDGFVTLTDRDEVNLLIALLAKNSGAHRVISLIHKSEYQNLVERVGLDASVSPRISAANTILRYVRRGPVASVATVKGSRAEALETVVRADSPIAGRRVDRIAFPRGAVLGALVRGEEVIMPRGSDTVSAGDHAIFFVLSDAIAAVERMLG